MEETVAIVRCRTYDDGEVTEAVRRACILGGLSPSGLPPRILLKPNMLSSRMPAEGTTTHPSVLTAAGRFCAMAQIAIGDSPANAGKPIEDYWNTCGYEAAARSLDARLLSFDRADIRTIFLGGRALPVPVAAVLNEWAVCNLPKLKTHNLTLMTAAVKNLYGLIPGYQKSILHTKCISIEEFSEFLVEFHRHVAPHVFFHIVDAVDIMEGNGPSGGSIRRAGYIIGGRDAIAVDMVCAELLGITPGEIPFLALHEKRYGLPHVIKTGDPIEPISGFLRPSFFKPGAIGKHRFLIPLARFLTRFFRIAPRINKKICKQCGACAKVCGMHAINNKFDIDTNACIRCFCCLEVCPAKAVMIEKSRLARMLT